MLKESNTTKFIGFQLQHVQPIVGFIALLIGFIFFLFSDSLRWILLILMKAPCDVLIIIVEEHVACLKPQCPSDN